MSSFDLVMPMPPNYRSDGLLSTEFQPIWSNVDSRSATIVNTTVASEFTDTHVPAIKVNPSARPKVEILRANSPTLKRLLAVRIKLDRYINSVSRDISVSPPFEDPIPQIILPKVNPEKQPSATNTRAARTPKKKSAPPSNVGQGPLDRITYEKTVNRNGNVKQKCSLEIWLPKAYPDDDEENGNPSRTISPKQSTTANNGLSPPQSVVQSRRASIVKTITSTANHAERKSLDDTPAKTAETLVIPRVYHFEKTPANTLDERPRSGKSGDTSKSEGENAGKTVKRRRHHRYQRQISGINDPNEEMIPPGIPVVPMSSKNLLENIRQSSSGQEFKGPSESTHSSMINDLMKKYSLMKKSHQELTQAKLQLEKPHQDSKDSAYTPKGRCSYPVSSTSIYILLMSLPDDDPSSLLPSESVSNVMSDNPSISVKKMHLDTSPRSAVDHHHTSTRLLERRSLHRKPPQSEVLPQTRLVTLFNQLQYRQVSASVPAPLLPVVIGKRSEDPFATLHRSKTFDFDPEADTNTDGNSSTRVTSNAAMQPDNRNIGLASAKRLQRIARGNEQLSPNHLKRVVPAPLFTLRTEEQRQAAQPILHLVQYHNVQSSTQRYHHTTHPSASTSSTKASTVATDAPNNKVLVHLKYSNSGQTDRDCLVPDS